MWIIYLGRIGAGLFGLALAGCQPSGPPPDIIKTQRDAMNKAKTIEVQLQQSQEQRAKADEDTQK